MSTQPSGQDIRTTVLAVVKEHSTKGSGFQSRQVLTDVSRRLGIHSDTDLEQAILTFFHDLFRSGHLAWGFNLSNPDPPFMHLTEKGRRALAHLSRDPVNYDGYMAATLPLLSDEPIATSYVAEACKTYQAGCVKAAAVMIGGASESLVLSLRDVVAARYGAGRAPKDLGAWQVKTVRDGLSRLLDQQKALLSKDLRERYEGFWHSGSDAFRLSRNEAGHPSAPDPVTDEVVHGTLLLFPEFARLVRDLKKWAVAEYQP